MLTADHSKNSIVRARRWGLWWLYLLIPQILVSIITEFLSPNIPLELLNLTIYIAGGISYTILLLGLRALSQEIGKDRLEKNLTAAMVLCIALGATFGLTFLPSLISENFGGLLFVSAIPLIFCLGIISIRMSTDFKQLADEWGESSRKAAKWHKISGYLFVTVLLMPVAGILSLIADYYMCRLIKERVHRGFAS